MGSVGGAKNMKRGGHGDEIKKAVGLLKETKPEQKKIKELDYSDEDYQKYFKTN